MFPEWLCDMPSLVTLDLGENRITRVPDRVARMPALRELDLRGNPLPAAEKERLRSLLPGVEVSVDAEPDGEEG